MDRAGQDTDGRCGCFSGVRALVWSSVWPCLRPWLSAMKDLSEDKVSDQDTADKVLEDLSDGVRHHNAGRRDEAEAMYRRVLKERSNGASFNRKDGEQTLSAGRQSIKRRA